MITEDNKLNPYPIYSKRYAIKDIQLEFEHRVTAQCRIGCARYRRKATCPPNVPSFEIYQQILRAYDEIVIIARRYPFADGYFAEYWREHSTNEIHKLLLSQEMELFKSGNIYAKAFIGGSCKLCSTDCNPVRCNQPGRGRAPLEATGMNVFSLMNQLGLLYENPPIHFFWRLGVVFY